MNRISLSVMLLVGIEASKEPFFVEAYKLRGDSACLFHRYGKRGSGPDELIEANSVYYHKPTRNMLLYSSNDMGAQLVNLDTYDIRPIHAFRQNNALWLMKAEFIDDSTLYGITESEEYEPVLIRYNCSEI